MSAAFWASLFMLRDGVQQLVMNVTRRLADLRHSGEPESPEGDVALAGLRADVLLQLENWGSAGLAPACAAFGAHADTGRCMRLVAFWVNERVCSGLEPADQADFAPV